MKRKLNLQKELYAENAFDAIGQIVIVIDAKGIIRLINKSGCALLETTRKQALNKDWFDSFLPNDTKAIMRNLFMQAIEKGESVDVFENEIFSQKGKKYFILWHSAFLRDTQNTITAILCSGQDVTAMRASEHKLTQSEEKYRTLVNNISQVVFDVHFKEDELKSAYPKNVLPSFVSESVNKLTGYSPEDFLSGSVIYQPLIHPDDRGTAVSAFWKMIEEKEAVKRIYRFQHKNGNYKWFEDNLIPRLDGAGKVSGWFGTVSEISERKYFETAIKDYEKFFHLSFDLFCIAGTDGYFKKINPSFMRVLGYSEAELLSRVFFDFVHKDDLKRTHHELKNLRKGIPTVSFENRYRCKDGSYRWLSWSASPAVNRNLIFAVARDISDRKTDEEKIRQNEAFLNSVVENIPSMIFVKDARELRFVRFNKAGEELLGFQREKMIGKNDYDFFPKSEADFFTKKDKEVLKKKSLADIRVEEIKTRYKGIRILHTKKIPLYDNAGKPEYLLGISEDITETIKAQEALKKSEEKYRDIVHLIQEGIWIIDADYITTFVNNEMAKMLGYAPEEMLGRNIFDFMGEVGSAIRNKSKHAWRKKLQGAHDFQFKTKDGHALWTILNFRELNDAKGKPTGAIAAVVNVTDRKKQEELIKENEQKLKEAQKIANVGSWEYDVASKKVTWSDETYRIFGIDPKMTPITRDLFHARVHPDDRDELAACVEAALQKGIAYELEMRILLPDKSIRYTFNKTRAIMKDGNVRKLSGTTMDITSKKLAETNEMKALVMGQDIERRRIAEDLHDSLGQKLSGIKILCESQGKEPNLSVLKPMLDEAIEEVRFISHNLMPSILEDFGLKNALKHMCRKSQHVNGTHISFRSYGVKQLNRGIEFGIYRIAQELLNNSLKHAHANEINLQLFERENKLILMLEDDGKGFNSRKTNFENTFGLNSITSRTKAMNGIFMIESQQGKGTVATVEIPLNT